MYSSIKALEQHLQHKMAQWNHTNLLSYCRRLLAAVSNSQRHTAAVAAARGAWPSVAYATAPDAAAVAALNGDSIKATATSAASASPFTGTTAVSSADVDSAGSGTAVASTSVAGLLATTSDVAAPLLCSDGPAGGCVPADAALAAPADTSLAQLESAVTVKATDASMQVATTAADSPAPSEQSAAASAACSAAGAALPWTPARPQRPSSSSMQAPTPPLTTSLPTAPPPMAPPSTAVLPQLFLPYVTAKTAPQPAPPSADALPPLPSLATALSQGCVAAPPLLPVPLPTAAVPLLPPLPSASSDQSQLQPPTCQSSPQTPPPLLSRSQSPSQPLPPPSTPSRMHQLPSLSPPLPPPPSPPPPTLGERPLLSPPDAASIATPPLAAAQARSVAVHPWEDQLTGLQASDAASQLVLAVAAATAASPGERAQAGQFPWPYYLIGTRDSFTNELVKLQTQVGCNDCIPMHSCMAFLSHACGPVVSVIIQFCCPSMGSHRDKDA